MVTWISSEWWQLTKKLLSDNIIHYNIIISTQITIPQFMMFLQSLTDPQGSTIQVILTLQDRPTLLCFWLANLLALAGFIVWEKH